MFEGNRAEIKEEKNDAAAAEIHYTFKEIDEALKMLQRTLSETNDTYEEMINGADVSENEINGVYEQLTFLRNKIANLKETRDRMLKDSNTDLEGGRAPQE